MDASTIEQGLHADSLEKDELLEGIETSYVALNAMAGRIKLEEDPMAIQERMRREWE